MRFRAAVLVSVALLVCGSGWAQTRDLSDVAGSIKLNPEAIVERTGIVERPRDEKKEAGELLGGILTECSASAAQLGELVDQARRATLFRGDDLLIRIEESSRELNRQVQEIHLLRMGGDFSEPYRVTLEAADTCDAAVGSVSTELDTGGATFTNAKAGIAMCRQNLGRATELLATVMNQSSSPAAAPAAVSTTRRQPEMQKSNDEIIAAHCEPERSKGFDAFDACQEEQWLSQAALASRSAGNEMLDEGVFADIRGICHKLYPQDFVGRNNCELDRMTGARLENE